MKNQPSFILLLLILCITIQKALAFNPELYRINLGRSSLRSSTMIGSAKYETVIRKLNYESKFNNEDFSNNVNFNSINNNSVFFEFDLKPTKSKKDIYRIWSFGVGFDRTSFNNVYRLRNNELASNSTYEEVQVSYNSRDLNLRLGHSWSSNPEKIIYGAIGAGLNLGIPLTREGDHTLLSYYYPSGVFNSVIDQGESFNVPFSIDGRLNIKAEIGLRVFKSFQIYGGLSGGINSLINFENGLSNYTNSAYTFGMRYDLASNDN